MIYDYREVENIQDVIFEDDFDLLEDIDDEVSHLHRYESIAIFTHAPIARDILGALLEEYDGYFVHADSENNLLYYDENKILITIGHDGCIIVENPRSDKGELKRGDFGLVYIEDSYSNKEAQEYSDGTNSILVFGLDDEDDECECDGDCDHCELISDEEFDTEDDDSSSVSVKVNGKEITNHEEKIDVAKRLIRDYCDYMDQANQLMSDFLW